jgi:hypothetical protein
VTLLPRIVVQESLETQDWGELLENMKFLGVDYQQRCESSRNDNIYYLFPSLASFPVITPEEILLRVSGVYSREKMRDLGS